MAGSLPFRCSICSRPYTDPRVLQCLHSFCLECLLQLEPPTKRAKKGSVGIPRDDCVVIDDEPFSPTPTISCPLCHELVALPPEGINSLPKHLKLSHEADIVRYEEKLNTSDPHCEACESGDYAVVFCCECREFLCDFCAQPHQKQRKTKTHALVDLSSNVTQEKLARIPKPDSCRSHRQPLDFVCVTCHQLPMCAKCALDRDHKGHEIKTLSEAASAQSNKFQKLAVAASVAVGCLEKAIESRGKINAGLQRSQSSIEAIIHASFEELEAVLKQQKQHLLHQCQQLATTKTNRLLDEMDTLDKLKTQIHHFLQTLFNLDAYGPKINGLIREVAAWDKRRI